MISYAQNLEDVMLARCFSDRRTGFYIDVGAGDPVEDSVTKYFYDLGWSGINIDPHRGKFPHLVATRPRDVNLQLAVTRASGRATFFELETWGLSSLKAESKALAQSLGEGVNTYQVDTQTLARICEQHVGSRAIDFLKIDVEGAERDVIASMDFARFPATIVVIEATFPNTQIATHSEWEDLLVDAGYSFVYFDGLNRFYVHRNALHLRAHFFAPPNVFDDYKRLAEVQAAELVDWSNTPTAERARQQAGTDAISLNRILRRESLTNRALTQAVESERAAKTALHQAMERMRIENAAAIQSLQQEAKKGAEPPLAIEQERTRRERFELFRLWNASKGRREAVTSGRRISSARRLRRRIQHRLAWVSPRYKAALEVLERHLGRDGTEMLYGQPFEVLNAKDLDQIVASPFWRDVVMPLETKEQSGGLFDPAYYCAKYPELEQWRTTPLRHYILHGVGEGRNPHLLFDCFWYLRNNPDITLSGQNPLFHFASLGGGEGRSPHPLFDSAWYLNSNLDVRDAGMNPLVHYLRDGAAEKRNPHPLFVSAWYLEHNPDVAAAGINPLVHFIEKGADAKRDPSPLFNVAWYLKQNLDLADARLNPLVHFLVEGGAKGRDPNPFFNASGYLAENADVARVGGNPLVHYLLYGAAMGRNPSPQFDTDWYLTQYPDVAKAGLNPLFHYLAAGAAEGRHPHPSYDRNDDVRAGPGVTTPVEDVISSRYQIRDFSAGQRRIVKGTKPLIVCVSHVFPWPPRAGNEYRIARILDWLTKLGHELLLVVVPFGNDEPNEKQRNDVFQKYQNVVVCYRDGRVLTSIKSLDLSFASINERFVADIFNSLRSSSRDRPEPTIEVERKWCHATLIGLLAEISKQIGDTIYYINYAFMTRFLEFLPRPTRSFVDTHDIFSQKKEKVGSFGIQNDVEISKSDEARMLRRADAVVAIHSNDAEELARLAPGKAIIKAGVDFSFADVGAPSPRPSILLVAFNNPLNVKGANDFLRFAWPAIKRAVPGVEFVVVGRVSEAIHYHDPQVKIAGVVDSLEPYYRDARVVVNPAVAGTGLKVKTVESVAYFRPIVTWPNGVDGIDRPVLQLCNVAHNWHEFAQKTIALLSAPEGVALLSSDREAIEHDLQADIVYGELGTWLDRR